LLRPRIEEASFDPLAARRIAASRSHFSCTRRALDARARAGAWVRCRMVVGSLPSSCASRAAAR